MATIRNFRFAVHLLTTPGDYIERSVTQTVNFGQSVHSSISYETVAQTVVLTGPVSEEHIKIQPAVTQTLVMSQSVVHQTSGPTIEQTIEFSQEVNDPPKELAEAQTVIFAQIAANSIQSLTVPQTVTLWDRASLTEWLQTVSQTVVLTGVSLKQLVRADAIALAGQNSFRLSQSVAFSEILKDAYNDVVFSQAVAYEYVWQLEQEVIFSQSVIDNKVLPLAVASTIFLKHAFLTTRQASECYYDPIFGGGEGGTTMPHGAPSRLVRQSNVKLVYPATADPQSWTNTVTLRNPEIGDRTKLQMDRIYRESRGGTLQTYRDDTWPTQETVGVAIRLCKDETAEEFSDFIDATLGAEIGFLDWEGNAWKGIMLATADPIVRTRNDIIDITFELVIIGSLT